MIGLNEVLKMGWDIVHNDSGTAANRLQALALITDSDGGDRRKDNYKRHLLVHVFKRFLHRISYCC
jgi:hypothetical protein